MEYKIPHGDDLRELREERGLSRKDVAQHFNVWPETVRRWEEEVRWPPRDTLIELLEYYEE